MLRCLLLLLLLLVLVLVLVLLLLLPLATKLNPWLHAAPIADKQRERAQGFITSSGLRP